MAGTNAQPLSQQDTQGGKKRRLQDQEGKERQTWKGRWRDLTVSRVSKEPARRRKRDTRLPEETTQAGTFQCPTASGKRHHKGLETGEGPQDTEYKSTGDVGATGW